MSAARFLDRAVTRWLIVLLGLVAVAAAGAGAWHWAQRPVVLTVAVGPQGYDDADLIAAFTRAFSDQKLSVRLSIVPTSGPVEALQRLTARQAQLAVARSDGVISDRVRAVAILHNDPVSVVASSRGKIKDFGSLKDKVLGVLGPPGANDALVTTLRRHYHAAGQTRVMAPVPTEVAAALRDRTIDALLFVLPTTRGPKLAENWAAIRGAGRRDLTFVPMEDAAAIAAAFPAYEAGEIPAGQFGGSPPLPKEEVTTIQVATYLVADRGIPADTVTRLTRALFEARPKVAADAPIASLMKAASTDTDAAIPVHPGAKVYYDGEEQTLMERYGDWIYIGPMLLGALGSGFLALLRFLTRGSVSAAPAVLSEVQQLIRAAREAQNLAELEAIRRRMDAVVEGLTLQAARGDVDAERTAVVAVAVSHVDHILAERRDLLLRAELMRPADSAPLREVAE